MLVVVVILVIFEVEAVILVATVTNCSFYNSSSSNRILDTVAILVAVFLNSGIHVIFIFYFLL